MNLSKIEHIKTEISKNIFNLNDTVYNSLCKHLLVGHIRFLGNETTSPARELRNKISHAYDPKEFREQNHIIMSSETCLSDVLKNEKLEEYMVNDTLKKTTRDQIIIISCMYYLSNLISFNKELLYSGIPNLTPEREAIEVKWEELCKKYKKMYPPIKIDNESIPSWALPWVTHSEKMKNIYLNLNKIKIEKQHRGYTNNIRGFFEILRHLFFKSYAGIASAELKRIVSIFKIYGADLIELIFFISDRIVSITYKSFFEKDYAVSKEFVKNIVTELIKNKNTYQITFPNDLMHIVNNKIKKANSYTTIKFSHKKKHFNNKFGFNEVHSKHHNINAKSWR